MAWGDYDNDGRLDLLLTGLTGYDSNWNAICISRVYHNNGDGSFTWNTNAALPEVCVGSVAWGDYDNDGRLDILLTGQTSDGSVVSGIYHNNGDGTFADINAGLPGAMEGGAYWGDFDNDGRLDVLVTGNTSWTTFAVFSGIYRNLSPVTNIPPTAPIGLTAAVSSNSVTLAWTAASDRQTPAAGLAYNLRVGTAPGRWDIVSPEADPASGLRRLPATGAVQRANAVLKNLPYGAAYYWSAQAVDAALAGSPFAAEGSFSLALTINSCCFTGSGQFLFQFTGTPSCSYTVLGTTNVALPMSNWAPFGCAIETSPGQYQFALTNAPGSPQRFFRLRWP